MIVIEYLKVANMGATFVQIKKDKLYLFLISLIYQI